MGGGVHQEVILLLLLLFGTFNHFCNFLSKMTILGQVNSVLKYKYKKYKLEV